MTGNYFPHSYFLNAFFPGAYFLPSGESTPPPPPPEQADIEEIWGSGGGGGLGGAGRLYPAQRHPTVLKPPRHRQNKILLPPILRDLSPQKLTHAPVAPGFEEQRQARWQAFRLHQHIPYTEFICYEWLTTKKKMTNGIEFQWQYPFLGGRTIFGGFVLDFYFPAMRLAWFVQGLHFHYSQPEDRGRDRMAVAQVANRGITVVQIFEDNLINQTQWTLDAAFHGSQIQREQT